MENALQTNCASTQVIELVGRQQLVVESGPDESLLKLVDSEGKLKLTLYLTSAGPILHFEGPGLMIRADGNIAIDAESVAIHGREGIALSSGGDARICASGDLTTEARIQNVIANLGNVNVKANDDVKLNGERVLLNC